MAYVLQLPVAFFRSAFVPAQSVFSDQTAELTTYDWRPFPEAPDEIVRIPCAPGEVDSARLRLRGAYLIGGFLALIGVAVLVISQVNPVLAKDRMLGLIFGLALLGLGIYSAVRAETEAVRLEARPEAQAVAIVWPQKFWYIHNVYAGALAAWQKQGSPLAVDAATKASAVDGPPDEPAEAPQEPGP
jgi:hypothetical protein